jgi:amino acid adenylation domain-containing protein
MGETGSSIQCEQNLFNALPMTIESEGNSHGLQLGHRNVTDWFRQQACQTPQGVAIVEGGDRLTYSELEVKSNQLAHLLRAKGVQLETVVGLYVTRSVAFVVAALGIWKAGGAYLPIDPELPADRMSFLLNDSQAPILVTEEKIANVVSSGNRDVVLLDRESERLNAMPPAPPKDIVEADNLAYVIYTSGSTGTPKGVEVTHRNLLNLIEWHQDAFRIKTNDRATQLAGLGFDAAVWEIWPYLTAGASVHFVPDPIRTAPDHLRDWLVENRITIGFVPTALAELLLTLDWPAKSALRLMLTGADALHRYPSPRLPFQLVNNYGPTECTVVATSGIIPPVEDSDALPPIGRAIVNARIYILDENSKQVTDGRSGELFIGGMGVARGYRNRPDLTAERFIWIPLANGNRERVYQTGDLVRMLPDGQLSFLGRRDEQIKMYGYRIEPNEIVHALEKHNEIQASCVNVREDTSGNKRLVAYLVTKPRASLSDAGLRSYLEQKLPLYMIPNVFVTLESLPLTPNGKIDRAALPVPESENVLRDAAVVAPRSAMERRVTEILSKLLGIAQVSIEDNFFLLGGHSLLGTQLIGRVRDAFGVDLPLRTVFDASTIAQLSAEIEKLLLAKLEAMSEEEARRLLKRPDATRVLENGG